MYNTEEIKQQAIDAIKENNLLFIGDIMAYVPYSKQTFYTHKLDEVDEIKSLLQKNRVLQETITQLKQQIEELGNEIKETRRNNIRPRNQQTKVYAASETVIL